MRRVFVAVLMFFVSFNGHAGYYVANVAVEKIRSHTDNNTYINIPGAVPQQACSNWNAYFIYDHTTETGKQFSSILLAAIAAERKVDIWYNASSAPGTTHNNGCTSATMAVVTGVSFN